MLKQSVIIVALTMQVAFAQTKQKIVATDLTRIKQVGGIQLAPDGQRALYTITTIEPNPDQREEYEYRTHLYLTSLKPGDSKALTRGAESVRQAAWSPDGKSVAFARTVKGKSQLFIMPLDGGEAWQLTNSPYGASGPRWSPDGSKIVYTTGVTFAQMLSDSVLNPGKRTPAWSLEKPGFVNNDFVKPDKKTKANPDGSLAEIRAYLNKDVEDKKAKVINRLNFQGEFTTEPDMSFTHLYVIDVRENALAKPLTRGFLFVSGSNLDTRWQNDSCGGRPRHLAASRPLSKPTPLIALPVDGSGRRTVLLEGKGRSYSAPELSPDGRWLAFLSSPSEGVNFGQLGVAMLNGTTVSSSEIVTFDRAAGGLKWATMVTTAGKGKKTATLALYFTAPSNGGVPLYRLDPATKQIDQLTDFESGVTAF